MLHEWQSGLKLFGISLSPNLRDVRLCHKTEPGRPEKLINSDHCHFINCSIKIPQIWRRHCTSGKGRYKPDPEVGLSSTLDSAVWGEIADPRAVSWFTSLQAERSAIWTHRPLRSHDILMFVCLQNADKLWCDATKFDCITVLVADMHTVQLSFVRSEAKIKLSWD